MLKIMSYGVDYFLIKMFKLLIWNKASLSIEFFNRKQAIFIIRNRQLQVQKYLILTILLKRKMLNSTKIFIFSTLLKILEKKNLIISRNNIGYYVRKTIIIHTNLCIKYFITFLNATRKNVLFLSYLNQKECKLF